MPPKLIYQRERGQKLDRAKQIKDRKAFDASIAKKDEDLAAAQKVGEPIYRKLKAEREKG